jgi:hypothetical protein
MAELLKAFECLLDKLPQAVADEILHNHTGIQDFAEAFTAQPASFARAPGIGVSSYGHVFAFLLTEGLISWNDADWDTIGPYSETSAWKRINHILKSYGWDGPFLDERRRRDRTGSSKKQKQLDKLHARAKRLRAELSEVECKIEQLNAPLVFAANLAQNSSPA